MKCPNCGEEMALQDTVWTCGGCGCSMPAKDCRACPNCGDKMTLRRNAHGSSEKWICTCCGFEMPFNGLPADDESAESKTSVLHCRFCGAPLDKRPDFCYECGAEQNGAYVEGEPQSAACPNCGNVLVIHDEQYGQVEMCLKCGYERHLDPNDPSEDAKRSDNRCRQCGAELVNNENFCPRCGAPQGRVCRNCGFTLEKGQNFCPKCGASIGFVGGARNYGFDESLKAEDYGRRAKKFGLVGAFLLLPFCIPAIIWAKKSQNLSGTGMMNHDAKVGYVLGILGLIWWAFVPIIWFIIILMNAI